MKRTIVCLCGSTIFREAFDQANYEETIRGHIVLTVGCYIHCSLDGRHPANCLTAEQKDELDQLHRDKIDLADEILVINVGGYYGNSTRDEIWYALARGKKIRFLEGPSPEDYACFGEGFC